MPRYHTYRRYLRNRFGTDVLKIPVNAGFSCPNRDGVKSTDGCTFCDNNSFSPVAEDGLPVLSQLQRAIDRHRRRFDRFIAYFQPYSNTYATVDRLKEAYEPLIAHPEVVGLAAGTRPDCLSDGICEYLQSVAGRTYLSVELGLQSSHDVTLRRINRGHTFGEFVRAVEELAGREIDVVAHVMIGLPGETAEMVYETARRVGRLPVGGVKIHQLMVIRGTRLEREYAKGEAPAMSLEEYAQVLGGFLERIRPDQHIHRLMADCSSERGLVAPLWSAEKGAALAAIQAHFDQADIRQGTKHATA